MTDEKQAPMAKPWAIIGDGKVSKVIRRPGDIILGHDLIEVTDPDSVLNALARLPRGTAVINTAAKINLEWCEENPGEARLVNLVGAQNILRACRALRSSLDLTLVQVSSGCIFDGGNSNYVYTEADIPTPACVYAKTKAEADLWLLAQGFQRLIIVRPRQLFSAMPYATNMLTKFAAMKSGRFITSWQSATCVEDLGSMISHLVSGQHYGVFNCANEGQITPFLMAVAVRDTLSPLMTVEPIKYDEYVAKLAVRRVNTLLSIEKLQETGFYPRSVTSALDWCLENYGGSTW